jgi:hypothetical protein
MLIVSRKTAELQGLKYYFTGKPCKKGHVCERLVSCRNCKECSLEEKKYRNAWKERNKNHIKKQYKEYRERNSEYLKKYHSQKYLKNRQHLLDGNKKWRKENPGKSAAIVRNRQSAQMQRTPKWADKTSIRNVYEEAARITKETGILMHVDHVIPLQGKFVSGLHVACNLQILSAKENVRKHNKFEEGTL